MNRNKYITEHTDKLMQNLPREHDDSQFNELLKAIATLHSTMQYNIDFEMNNTTNHLKYNLPINFHTPAYGMIQLSSEKPLSIDVNTMINSFSKYKTVHKSYINTIKILEVITEGLTLEIKIEGKAQDSIDFFASNEVINSIFGNETEKTINNMFGVKYKCTLHNSHSIFANMGYKFLSFFRISGIQMNTPILSIKIPMAEHYNIQTHMINTNYAIVINEFQTSAVINNGVLTLDKDHKLVKINHIYENGIEKPNSREDPNGWFVEEKDGIIFVHNVPNNTYANITCCNQNINTQHCNFEDYIPAVAKWKIPPTLNEYNNKKNMFDIFMYITSSPTYIAKLLCKNSGIQIKDIKCEQTVINTYYTNNYIAQEGYKLQIETYSNNFILFRKIKEEINRFFLTELIVINDKGEYLIK